MTFWCTGCIQVYMWSYWHEFSDYKIPCKLKYDTEWTIFLLTLLSVDFCYEGEVTLARDDVTYVEYPTGESEVSGRAEVCVDGEFVGVCQGGPIDAGLVCNNLGFPGMVQKFFVHNE